MALSKKQVEAVKNLTNRLYRMALIEINALWEHERDFLNLRKALNINTRAQMDYEFEESFKKLEIEKELISREYERLICLLPTKKLEQIIQAHKEGKYRRAQYTLDAITTELLERSIQDSVRNKGKSNGKSKTAKRPSAKAKNKSSRKPGRGKATRR